MPRVRRWRCLQITEYDRLLFARLELDFASNCQPALHKLGMACYREPPPDGMGPVADNSGAMRSGGAATSGGEQLMAGPGGFRQAGT